MNEAPILLSDFSRPHELVEALKAELNAMFEPDTFIHYKQFKGMSVKEALAQLSAGILRVVPDLLIVLLSGEARASAPSIFPVLLGQKRCPPIVAVPSSEEPSGIDDLYRLGASDYLIPPFRAVDVRPRLWRLLPCHRRPETPFAAVKESLGSKQFVGENPALLGQLQKLPPMNCADRASASLADYKVFAPNSEDKCGKVICLAGSLFQTAIFYTAFLYYRPFKQQ